MRYGDAPARRHDLSSLERVVCAGEVLNAPAWEWLQKQVFDDRVPVIDHMWQTETGGPVFGNPYGIAMLPIKPGSATIPLPGIDAAVVDAGRASRAAPGEKGIMVITRPFPGLTPTLWGEPERYGRDYWEQIPGVYYTGDSAHIDEDGYVWFAGRADEIIKIAGHRIGTIEVESAFLKHPAVAEAGVTGRPDELRGEVISAFVVLKQGHDAVRRRSGRGLLETVRRELGPGRGHRRAELRDHAAQDAQRQDHAPRAQGRDARHAIPATSRRSRTKARSTRPGRRGGAMRGAA